MTIAAPRPVPIGRNTPPTFYRGAGRIDLFRGGAPADASERPEDWVASTVTRWGEETSGLTMLDAGGTLRDEVRADPMHWLGRVDRPAPELSIPLVKLLDAGQRLPVHAHPSDACARELGVWPNGKAEAWFVVEAPTSGVVHLGWTRDIAPAELVGWVEEQDVAGMLAAMHTLTVTAGDSVYVPPGTAHAIGEGILLVEVQQAADLSILLEWKGLFPDSSGAFLGCERAAALRCVDLHGLSAAQAEALVVRAALDLPTDGRLLPPPAAQYFSATVFRPGSVLPAEYRTLVVLSGAGTLAPASSTGSTGSTGSVGSTGSTAAGPVTAVSRGETFAVPAAAGPLTLTGSGDLRVLAFGPGVR
ncbi:class I mannose-6-phosphate isomerase [Pengzhenrongella frigida]|uniref:Mannose-6-phosphate isomerase n=1 Tax=Pengzhenrongella frigida TaxID=1259133 RepID=A0A4Q5N0F7_9MICO|nr:class I mannose-6-phosphate isomerase [Cellulomonas sp. HLT2-17]RYV51510.1 hypothetical protein EUA98_07965 [Cellulomonas sp. HLT2-17]